MRDKAIIPSSSPAIRYGVLVLHGYGVRVTVDRGHLVVSDGLCDERREIRLHRATCGLRRLVVIGHSGIVTLDALQWLRDIKAGVAAVDADGRVFLASGPGGLNDARLRRAQALAASNGVGLKIIVHLLRDKLVGQADVLRDMDAAHAAANLCQAAATLDNAGTLDRLRMIEASCAAEFWKRWESVRVAFARRDESYVPNHWRVFGTRSSPLTGQPRLAANPANALLNYLYGILETEAQIACQTMGLDAGIGILHTDQPSRDSLALDLIEPVRPQVDAFLLQTLSARTFARDDFAETRQGVCRVSSSLTCFLAETAPKWARALAPIAEYVARTLADSKAAKAESVRIRIPSPLTQANRSAGRDGIRRQIKVNEAPRYAVPPACRVCGVVLDDTRRIVCDECLPGRRTEVIRANAPKAIEKLHRLRESGQDPAHSFMAVLAQERTRARHRKFARAWERTYSGRWNPEDFRRTILPLLSRVSLGQMARVTGLSKGYLSFVRRGVYVPHPRHWSLLRDLLGGTMGAFQED